MDFQLHCECGRYVGVSEGSAGSRLPCECGRMISVPSLAELRRQAGLAAYRPPAHLVIENMLAHGELPTLSTCAGCNHPTEEITNVTAECEKVSGREPSMIEWIVSFMFFPSLWLLAERQKPEYGKNVILHLPVRICSRCHKQLLSNKIGRALDVAAIVFAVAALFTMILWTLWGVMLFLGSALALVAEMIIRDRRRETIRTVLESEPIYKQLLSDHPHAKLIPKAS